MSFLQVTEYATYTMIIKKIAKKNKWKNLSHLQKGYDQIQHQMSINSLQGKGGSEWVQ